MSIRAVHERKRGIPTSTPKRNDISNTTSDNGSLCKFEEYIHTRSLIYQRIIAIKRNYGNNHRVAAEFENRRKHYKIMPKTSFRDQFEQIFAGINHAVGNLFTGDNVGVFLDLGCAPGGFSKFILDNNASARGLGITLLNIPILTEGTRLADAERYRVQEGDITILNFDARSSKYCSPSARVKLEATGYDLIIAGAFPTLQAVSAVARATLALSQLHAILSNLQSQGTCIVVANTKPFLWNLEMFAVLRRVFVNIQPAKHGELHAIRSSCYFVCTGFDADEAEALSLKRKVKWALDSLKAMNTEDKNFSDELLIFGEEFDCDTFIKNEHQFFLDIMQPLWATQFDAIEIKLNKALHPPTKKRAFRYRCEDRPVQRVLRVHENKM